MLQNLAAEVQVQIRRIHYAFDEAQIFGDLRLAILHDEDPLSVLVNTVAPLYDLICKHKLNYALFEDPKTLCKHESKHG
jgi:hypothetical protein